MAPGRLACLAAAHCCSGVLPSSPPTNHSSPPSCSGGPQLRARGRPRSGGRGAAWRSESGARRRGPAAGERRAQGAGEARAKPSGGQAGRHRTAARRVGREERRGELGFAGGELGRTPAQQRAAQQGGEARVATCGHIGSDVAVHVGSQRWSEVF